MIADKINQEIHTAMKSGDKVRLSTLKLLASALAYDKISKQRELTEDEEISVVKSEAKKRRDAIEMYEKANSPDRVKAEKEELAILEAYLPPELSNDELVAIVEDVLASMENPTTADMGRIMGAAVAKAKEKGGADGSRISSIVRAKLS